MAPLWIVLICVCSFAFVAAKEVALDVSSFNDQRLVRSANWGTRPERSQHGHAKLSFSFVGNGLSVQVLTYRTFGMMRINLDGHVTQLDTYAAPPASLYWKCGVCPNGLSNGTHNVTLENLGATTNTTGSGGAWIGFHSISYFTLDTAAPSSPTTPTPPTTDPTPNPTSDPKPSPGDPDPGTTSTPSDPAPGTSTSTSPSSLPTTSGQTTGSENPRSIPGPDTTATSTEGPLETTSTDAPGNPQSNGGTPIAAIAGGVAGGIALIALLALALWLGRRRRQRRTPTASWEQSTGRGTLSPYIADKPSASPSPPPTISTEKQRRLAALRGESATPGLVRQAYDSDPRMSTVSSSHRDELRDEVRELRERLDRLAHPPRYGASL